MDDFDDDYDSESSGGPDEESGDEAALADDVDDAASAASSARGRRARREPVLRHAAAVGRREVVPAAERLTGDRLQQLELANIVATRAEMISRSGTAFIAPGALDDPVDIALAELYARRCPLLVVRRVAARHVAGQYVETVELWEPNSMTLPDRDTLDMGAAARWAAPAEGGGDSDADDAGAGADDDDTTGGWPGGRGGHAGRAGHAGHAGRGGQGARATPAELVAEMGATCSPEYAAAAARICRVRAAPPSLVMREDDPRLTYVSGTNHYTPAVHHGQRKLFLSEVDFLIWCRESGHGRPGDVVVYAGSAPGVKMMILAALFPEFEFELHDPNPFTHWAPKHLGGLYDNDPAEFARVRARVRTHSEYFTPEVAARYAAGGSYWRGRGEDARGEGGPREGPVRVLFVSDIRRSNDDGSAPSEAVVAEDMRWQMEWIEQIQPAASMVKFRPPYSSQEGVAIDLEPFEYLDGEVHVQAWSRLASSEGRLISRWPYSRRAWDPIKYEDQYFYRNSVERAWGWYAHPHRGAHLDHCYDCALEVGIWERWLASLGTRFAPAERAALAAAAPKTVTALAEMLSRAVFRNLNDPPHGLRPEAFVVDKYRALIAPVVRRRHQLKLDALQ